jgi:hypothetical protein
VFLQLPQAIMALYEHPVNGGTKPTITGSILKTPLTGVDCNTSFTLNFNQSKLAAQAILSCNMNVKSMDPGVTIRYTRGAIKVASPISVPKSFVVQHFDQNGAVIEETKKDFEYVGL